MLDEQIFTVSEAAEQLRRAPRQFGSGSIHPLLQSAATAVDAIGTPARGGIHYHQ